MSRTILLILAAYFLRHSTGCKTNLQYVAPAGDLNCLPCEQDAVSWPIFTKIFWFIMRVWSMGHLKYDCCKVEVESIDRRQILRSRRLQSDPNCGLKGRPLRWRKKHAENQTLSLRRVSILTNILPSRSAKPGAVRSIKSPFQGFISE